MADSAEIKFECSQCGQSLSVDPSGAGMTTSCPTCESPVIVPQPRSLDDRHYGASAPVAHSRPTFQPDATDELGEEVADLRRRNQELELGLTASGNESARLQQQIKELVAENERQTASAVAAQAEALSLRVDRQQIGSEFAAGQQQAERAEAQLRAAREKISQIEAELAAGEENRAQWAEAYAQMTARGEALEAQLASRESELAQTHAELAVGAQALAAACAQMAGDEAAAAILRRQLDTAEAGLADAVSTRAALAATQQNLAAAQRTLEKSEADRQSLASRCAGLRADADMLRHDLSEIHDGRELLGLRDRFKALTTDHERATGTLARTEIEAKTLAASEQQLRAELAETRTRAERAERRAEAAAESALSKDNEVLRGIIARQNAVQEERYAELLRLRRARLGLRILYAIVGLALIGLAAFAIEYLPAEVKRLLHDWFGI